MFYKWGISTSHGHNQGCKDSYSSILTRRRTWTIERRVFIFMVIIMCLWMTKRNRIWTMKRFLFIYLCLLSYVFEWQREKNTNNKEEGCISMVIIIFLRMTKRKNNTNNKERVAQRRIYSWAAFPISRSLSISRVFFPLFYCCF